MKLKIYSDLIDKGFFMPAYYLEKEGKLENVEMIGSRFLYYAYMGLKGKKVYPFFKSLFAPIKLLFTKYPIILGFAPYRSVVYYLVILKLLRKNIIYYTSWPYWDGSGYVHAGGYIRQFFWKRFLKNTKTICITEKACGGVNILGAKGVHIPHPIDLGIFTKKTKSNKDLNVLFVGRLLPEKGVLDVLRLAEEFKDINFTFVGKGELEDKVKNCGLSNVKYEGFVEDKKELAKIYRQADIFISNSYATKNWEELFGIVIIEAMASGLAVIASDCVGPKEIIQNGENGILVHQKDYNGLKEKFGELIKNKRLIKNLGDNGMKTVEEKYDIKIISKKWMDLINEN